MKYRFIHSIEEEDGEPHVINGQNYYYHAYWTDILAEMKKQGIKCEDDLRLAGDFLGKLGIPNIRSFAEDTQEDYDGEPMAWDIYWA